MGSGDVRPLEVDLVALAGVGSSVWYSVSSTAPQNVNVTMSADLDLLNMELGVSASRTALVGGLISSDLASTYLGILLLSRLTSLRPPLPLPAPSPYSTICSVLLRCRPASCRPTLGTR